jgi:hypothetical protein
MYNTRANFTEGLFKIIVQERQLPIFCLHMCAKKKVYILKKSRIGKMRTMNGNCRTHIPVALPGT